VRINAKAMKLTYDQAQLLRMASPTQRREWAKTVLSNRALDQRLGQVEEAPTGDYATLNEAIAAGDQQEAKRLLAKAMDVMADA
jgi:hypothetical protein